MLKNIVKDIKKIDQDVVNERVKVIYQRIIVR